MYGAKDEGSFEAHAPYLREAFDEGTKATQLVEVKLQSEGLSTRQKDAEASTLEEYATMLPFELSQRKRCTTKIVYDRSGWIATDSGAMGLSTPWYREGGTSVESSIPYSNDGRALVVKEAEEMEITEPNSK
ncbi:hypothetical protein B296_00030108 [Ensete ventricosum]|uniref:Uncharacterized protein n=1 Tax=Ensete ventricosum TaxID=4639 RepID=A0A427A9F9_ENSVE|nr:hypothetical protein B296_00030108 [Ensete ventricosum]